MDKIIDATKLFKMDQIDTFYAKAAAITNNAYKQKRKLTSEEQRVVAICFLKIIDLLDTSEPSKCTDADNHTYIPWWLHDHIQPFLREIEKEEFPVGF